MEDYAKIANNARKKVLEMVHKAGTSHIGSNFSCIDIMAVLFSRINLDKNLKENRDRFILSKGWVAASLYYFLAEKGIIPKNDLDTYCIGNSKYIGLAEPEIRGVEMSGGSMGHGLPFALGSAIASKLSKENLPRQQAGWKTYVLMSDGELNCGTTWESAMLASQHKLNNLIVIIDNNGFQAMGKTKEVIDLEPLAEKWKAFGWNVAKIDGHNYTEIEKALNGDFTANKEKPSVIIAKTTKGKGVSFFENKLEWHYKNVDLENYQKALAELNNNLNK
ncbi:MAG: hypothetical protein A2312_00100 [Candidatus Staskawiczbacteria bacterium RIFOXYB2_FULL_32_9]|uniref:Transketolase N-terminal domain-containing protein n=1 Tax=Candidatus Staskawiczbacteria bacterium RIFOXYD1_FULL_32_13 TaxID=1802234 RepID=A0A1G2JLN8_9BACT|nr:MAG: hypothetical protein UR22_C0006G0037 [Parcubacteria group bacterium GW2011_GWC2_32_10]OGZ79721.1 MAG: hypothetical protein A2256_01205 [Candidatus Staskawiczbacteria bacterium RIFOXYA2_FULL_32_7]OGZ84831.1 MAG: hypothetical protein A2312_00100 [Candidatus Staskawiczbacteria bacterium RIFOXYB2_FULL_32_9]OGZ85842.1 MAG: hypothetical protein A2463_03095 [Candidatus Staskawiczbacteria bacterium RIFOXYC2_FULL_32_10]OGZ87992.1 MAG: hypothetical protein A2561_02785 [Candidatus Staskawiczbacter